MGGRAVDFSVEVTKAVAVGVLGLYIAWRVTAVLTGREHLGFPLF